MVARLASPAEPLVAVREDELDMTSPSSGNAVPKSSPTWCAQPSRRSRRGDLQVVPSQRFELPCRATHSTLTASCDASKPESVSLFGPTAGLRHRRVQPGGARPGCLGAERTTSPYRGHGRPRGATPEQDAAFEAELVSDEKEAAEHLMLAPDLGRNDLGRVCVPGTVPSPSS